MPECPLCLHKKVTRQWFEDSLIWIADCLTCGCPIAVIKRHTSKPNEAERQRIKMKLGELVRFLEWNTFKFDDRMNSIKDHYHVHLRKP